MAPFDLDIGVIYTHERELMPRLLATTVVSGDGLRMRLILVDNASADGVEQWCRHLRNTKVLRNPRRLSYAANLNRILGASAARYVLLLNTDMYFDPRNRCLARMAALMDARPECGVAGCRLFHADGSDAHAARRFQTLPLVLARRGGLGWLLRHSVRRHFYAERAPDGTWTCDWLSGCFLWLRRTAVEKVGPFDEAYGKYFEDADMCRRMGRAGWSVVYHGAASCYHLETRASKNLLSADAWLHFRAYLRWLHRWALRPVREIHCDAAAECDEGTLPAPPCSSIGVHGGMHRPNDALPSPAIPEFVQSLETPAPSVR
jgi:GT2 family glycosyltransferase